jgi:hypothetical protein
VAIAALHLAPCLRPIGSWRADALNSGSAITQNSVPRREDATPAWSQHTQRSASAIARAIDDDEVDRVGDTDLVGGERIALGAGRLLGMHGMQGRRRGYEIRGSVTVKSALTVAFHDRCDHDRRNGRPRQQRSGVAARGSTGFPKQRSGAAPARNHARALGIDVARRSFAKRLRSHAAEMDSEPTKQFELLKATIAELLEPKRKRRKADAA